MAIWNIIIRVLHAVITFIKPSKQKKMSNEVIRDINLLVPELQDIVKKLQMDLIMFNIPIRVFETKRTAERQAMLVQQGYSKTLKSKHIEGKACDFVVYINNQWSWDNKYEYLYRMFGALTTKYSNIVWGGQKWANWNKENYKWSGFLDFPHIQII